MGKNNSTTFNSKESKTYLHRASSLWANIPRHLYPDFMSNIK